MPVTWGHAREKDENKSMGCYDMSQYAKWFELNQCDFEVTYRSGQWSCSAWSRLFEIDDTLDRFSYAKSHDHETIASALQECYAKMKENIAERRRIVSAMSGLSIE